MLLYVTIPDVVPLERLWQMLVPVIPVSIIVRVVAILVSPSGLATLQAGLGVVLLLEQLLKILLILGGSAEPDLLILATTAGTADSDVQVVISQLCDDLQHGLRTSAQVGNDLGADAVRPAPLLPWR